MSKRMTLIVELDENAVAKLRELHILDAEPLRAVLTRAEARHGFGGPIVTWTIMLRGQTPSVDLRMERRYKVTAESEEPV